MSDSFHVFGVSPIVAVADVRSAVDFHVKHLGFRELFVAEDGSYGVAGLQNQSVHFVPAADKEALASTAKHCSDLPPLYHPFLTGVFSVVTRPA
jgi:hypothetical protein